MTRKRLLVTGGLALWGAVLVGLAIWASRGDLETVREHSELTEARAALDAAADNLRSAAGPATTSEPGPVRASDCRISLARGGTELDQLITFTVPPDQEPHLLQRLADEVPDGWLTRYNPATHRLSADAGDFVRVVGKPGAPGRVEVALSTGCRPA
jgi:hypothetical protein